MGDKPNDQLEEFADPENMVELIFRPYNSLEKKYFEELKKTYSFERFLVGWAPFGIPLTFFLIVQTLILRMLNKTMEDQNVKLYEDESEIKEAPKAQSSNVNPVFLLKESKQRDIPIRYVKANHYYRIRKAGFGLALLASIQGYGFYRLLIFTKCKVDAEKEVEKNAKAAK